MISQKQLLSGAVMVASGIIPPAKLLRWINRERAKDFEEVSNDMAKQVSIMKFLLDAHQMGRITEPKLRQDLGRWVNGVIGAQLAGLEFESELKPK